MIVYAAGVVVCHRENLWTELWYNLQYLDASAYGCNTCIFMIPGTHDHCEAAPTRDYDNVRMM